MKGTLYPSQELKRRALAWAIKLKVNPKMVRIQKMKTKWGSCSSCGIVTFAEELIDMDVSFQDFVIVHELLHLRYPNHGRLFKASMSAHIPRWRDLESERVCS